MKRSAMRGRPSRIALRSIRATSGITMTIRIGTSERDGTFHSQGLALQTILERHAQLAPVEVLESRSASVDNAKRLQAGEMNLPLSTSARYRFPRVSTSARSACGASSVTCSFPNGHFMRHRTCGWFTAQTGHQAAFV